MQLPIFRRSRAGVARALAVALALFILPAWVACTSGDGSGAAPAATDAALDAAASGSPTVTAIPVVTTTPVGGITGAIAAAAVTATPRDTPAAALTVGETPTTAAGSGAAAAGVSTPTAGSATAAVPQSSSAPAADGVMRVAAAAAEQARRKYERLLRAAWATDFSRATIAYSEIKTGGPPKDGIPAIDDPQFESVAAADAWLDDREPVQVVNINGDARAYPVQVMVWHELVNDTVGGEAVVITF